MRLPFLITAVSIVAQVVGAQTFHLPTANRAILNPGAGPEYFVPTVGKTWQSGTFGCVRTDGRQMHEGIDIKCITRNKAGEPTDAIMATAAGTVAYVNTRPSLSNYGNYIVLRHMIEGIEIYSLYAHLSSIRPSIKVGASVQGGEVIATMGRSTNTGQGISKDRAHLHFELDFFVNDKFSEWFRKSLPGQRNDHGDWNGRNMIALDPQALFVLQHQQGTRFSFKNYVQSQTEMCRVLVREKDFQWLKRYSTLVADTGGKSVVAWELVLNFNGLPFKAIPRFEAPKGTKYQLLAVNPRELQRRPCRRLIYQRSGRWQLAPAGMQMLDLLTY